MTNLIVAAFTLCYFAVTLFLCRGMRLSARDICLAGLMSAATLVLRCFLITLPNGSHISLGAMLPILLLSLLVNARVAFCAGWVTGLLAMLLLPDWQPVHWAQPFVEQLICFSALGYASVFGTDRRWKIILGTTLAVALSVTSHIMAGAVFFAQYAWDGYGPWAYSIVANLSGHGTEGLLPLFLSPCCLCGGWRNPLRQVYRNDIHAGTDREKLVCVAAMPGLPLSSAAWSRNLG